MGSVSSAAVPVRGEPPSSPAQLNLLPWRGLLAWLQMYKGPKPAPQQALTERQVADAQAANAAAEAAEAAATTTGGSSPSPATWVGAA